VIAVGRVPSPRETPFEELRRYVRLGGTDARLIAAFGSKARPHFRRIARDFYERIREHEEANAVLASEEQVARLQKSLVSWLERVCSGVYDEAYFEAASRIGRVHVEVGLPQRYVLTAMALIRVELARLADETMGTEAGAVRSAVGRLLDLELAVMLEAYQQQLIERLSRIEELERKELGRALARSEHRYRNAVELARLLIIGLDASGDIQLYNREAERVTGFGRDEVIGRPFVDVLLPEALHEIEGKLFLEACAGKIPESGQLEAPVRLRSGKARDVRWRLGFAPATEGGDDVVLFALGADITGEKALAERARQSEKLAAVGTLAAGLAHEIRNPLNGAQLHITFLERALKRMDADADAFDAIHVVGDEFRRLSSLVSEFLDFARPRPLSKKPLSMRQLARRVARLVATKAVSAGATLKLELPAADVKLDADGERLEQVLLNLLHNAIEAVAPSGGGRVVLRVVRQPRAALIEVEDEGPGLPSADAPIFDAFFSTKPNGTGLGLAIVHRIVTDHGGTITVESRPGRTVMRVSLPAEIAESA
jgi:PAS domain S-box-containing protein